MLAFTLLVSSLHLFGALLPFNLLFPIHHITSHLHCLSIFLSFSRRPLMLLVPRIPPSLPSPAHPLP